MASFAPVASLDFLKELEHRGEPQRYFLLLAHKVLEEPERWQKFFAQKRDQGTDIFVIMDNSLIELGRPLRPIQMVEAVNLVKADVVVLPDKLRDARATVNASLIAADDLAGQLSTRVKFMGVAQGETAEELYACAERLTAHPRVRYLSVPRVATAQFGSRIELVKHLDRLGCRIHLLGFSEDLADDIDACHAGENVIGIDSTEPLRMGLAGLHIKDKGPVAVPERPKDWLDLKFTPDVLWNAMVRTNLRWMKAKLGSSGE